MPKLQPAVMTLNYRLDGGIASGWCDLSHSASLVNRRFYRQGLQWAVAGISWQRSDSTTTTGALQTEILPTTWVCSNAWHKAFANWRKQQNDALRESDQESIAAKFRDFKIFMDTAMYDDFVNASGADGSAKYNNTVMLPRTLVNTFKTGEWAPSQVVLPNTASDGTSDVDPTEHYLHMVGGVGGGTGESLGLIAGYAFSRSVPQSPDPVVDPRVNNDVYNWMRNMFDDGNADEEILENTQKNDELPYDQLEYPNTGLNPEHPSGPGTAGGGLQLHDESFITSTTIGGRVNVPGFMAPCGLIKFTKSTDLVAAQYDIQVHLVPGNHRGYLASPMQDM